MRACLDSWALLAWLDGEEPAATIVEDALKSHPRPLVSWINAAEVHYRVARDHGGQEADRAIAELESVVDLEGVSREHALAAARLKATRPIALGDCFCIALAEANGATILTGDPEIIDAVGIHVGVRDLRAPGTS